MNLQPADSSLAEFQLAGWSSERRVAVDAIALADLRSYAIGVAILTQFGGLHVGRTGAGDEWATADILFHTKVTRLDLDAIEDRTEYRDEDLFPIAIAQRTYLELFVGESGRIFCGDVPTGGLNIVGHDFPDAMERLLRGRHWVTETFGS